MRILSKFGGSSLASAEQFIKVKDIIDSDKTRKIIVVSAPGKDELNKSKVTDLLLLLHAHLEYDFDYDHLLDNINQRFSQIIADLKIRSVFFEEFTKFTKTLNKGISKDYLVSRGEYFNAIILSEYLGYTFIDAKKIIYLNYDGTINYEKTEKELKKFIQDEGYYVIPGFYASTPEKEVRVFNRGGSDLSGSIISRILNVDLYENWTDVSGLYVADPKIIDNPKRIKKITYNELRELSYRGANVIQQESVIPLDKTDIPIQIKNTNSPKDFGTFISRTIDGNGEIITGLSGQTDFTSLTIIKDSSISFAVILKEVLSVFIKYKLSIEHIPTGIDTISIITKTSNFKKVYFDLVNEVRNIEGIIDINIEDEVALVAIVGRNMSFIPGVAGKIFSTLGKNEINIKVIAQASKEISIIIGVKNTDYESAIKVLYQEFYN
jgi:aspartate kinase